MNLYSKEALEKDFPFDCQWGNPLANVSKVIGNLLAKLLQGIRGHWQSLFQIPLRVLAILQGTHTCLREHLAEGTG
jgi:hypothetical protein